MLLEWTMSSCGGRLLWWIAASAIAPTGQTAWPPEDAPSVDRRLLRSKYRLANLSVTTGNGLMLAAPARALLRRGRDVDLTGGDYPGGKDATGRRVSEPRLKGTAENHASAESLATDERIQFAGYQVLRALGDGGQGHVLQAVRLADNRRVAIKIIRSDRLGDHRARARFEQERAVLDQLDHPGIPRVLESGELGDGEVWFATEYVTGQPLDRYVDDLDVRRRKEHPQRKLTFPLDATLKLFVKVCEIMEDAHRTGIIHRDIKPSNILVDADGNPHVLDFGLARPEVADPQLATLTGEYLGSPAWSSPEQVEGDPAQIDVRTDVYSLSVVLYRVCTGVFPYEVDGPLSHVFDEIRHKEPIPPRAHVKFVDADLQAILLKALAKDRQQRYASMAEFREDLQRYLRHEPVRAREWRPAYALRKFVLRHRVASLFILAGVVSAVGYATTVTLLYRRALVAEDEARHHAARALKYANRARQTSEMIINDLDGRLQHVIGAKDLRLDLLESAYDSLAELSTAPGADADLEDDHARILARLSAIRLERGDVDQALQDRQTVLDIRKRLLKRFPNELPRRADYSIALVLMGDIDKHRGEYVAALHWYEQALEIDEQLVQAQPGNAYFVDNLVWSYERMAWVCLQLGQVDRARHFHERRFELAAEFSTRQPASLARRFGAFAALSELAAFERERGDTARADRLVPQAHEIIVALADTAPNDTRIIDRLGQSHIQMALAAERAEDWRLVSFHRHMAEDVFRRLVQAEPDVTAYQRALAGNLGALARIAWRAGDRDTALARWAEAADWLQQTVAAQPTDWLAWRCLLNVRAGWSEALFDAGRQAEAEEHGRAALDILGRLAARPGATAEDLRLSARAMLRVHPPQMRNLTQAVALAQRAVDCCGRPTWRAWATLAEAHCAAGQVPSAMEAFGEAIAACADARIRASLEARLAQCRAAPAQGPDAPVNADAARGAAGSEGGR